MVGPSQALPLLFTGLGKLMLTLLIIVLPIVVIVGILFLIKKSKKHKN